MKLTKNGQSMYNSTQLAKMSFDPKFVEPTTDVVRITLFRIHLDVFLWRSAAYHSTFHRGTSLE